MVKVAALLGVAALAVAACAPATKPPNVPVEVKGAMLVNVVDSLFDAGRSPSVQIDQDGVPAVAYLLYQPVLKEGEIPPAPKPGDPNPPSVMLATQSNGIWTRSPIPPQKALGPAVGGASEIANADGQAVAGVSAALALDGQGKHHVAWATPQGLFYSTDASGSFVAGDKVSTGASYGVSIAVGGDGTVWISWYGGGSLNVAHGSAGNWTTEQAAVNAGPATHPAIASSIRLSSSGTPMVAFGSQGTTEVASQSGGSWRSSDVSGPGGYGVSLAVDKDGSPHVAYYDANGGVHVAHQTAAAAWQVEDVATTTGATPGQPDPRWSTGIGVDDQGHRFVTWADTKAGAIFLGSDSSGQFTSQEIQGSDGGANPSLAVSADGKTVALGWFDATNANLDVAVPATASLALAHPLPTLAPASAQPSAAPTGTAPPCEPSGDTIQISAQGSTFDKDCLAAPAGAASTIEFTNNDAGVPHNVDVYDQQGGSHIGGAGPTEFFPGPGTTTYTVPALDAGTYFFQCDVHPTSMFGTFVVAKAG